MFQNAHSIRRILFLPGALCNKYKSYYYCIISVHFGPSPSLSLSALLLLFASLTKMCDFFLHIFFYSIFIYLLSCVAMPWNTQFYRRCDAVVIDDNAQSNNKRVFDTAAVANGPPTKEHDRRLKKNSEKCRTKTGMYSCVCCCVSVWESHCAWCYQFKDSMGFDVCLTVEILHFNRMINVVFKNCLYSAIFFYFALLCCSAEAIDSENCL